MSALKEVWILFILFAFTNATEISNEVFTNQPWTSPFQVDCSRIFSGIAGLNCTEHNDDRHAIKLGYLTSIKNTSKGIYNRLPLVIHPYSYLQLRTNANGRLPFYEAKLLFSEGHGRM